MSEVARRDGILALEDKLGHLEDGFLGKGIAMAVDGTEPEAIQGTLAQELEETHARHEAGKQALELIARYAPAYGMLGTLTGLIHMLTTWGQTSLNDPMGTSDHMLPKMAFALVTTFCGIFLANTIALPLCDKFSEKDREEMLHKKIIISGILAIQSGDSPRMVKEKLNIFLPPNDRL